MSRAMGSPMRGRRRVVGAVLGATALFVASGIIAALILSGSPAPEPNGLCEIATNDAYMARVDGLLADYEGIVADNDDLRFDPATMATRYGFTVLFQMQACSIDESDLIGTTPNSLRYVIYDPEYDGDEPAAPIDIEVTWYAELGVDGLIGGWSSIARLDRVYGLRNVQRLLSLGLAHVTNPDRDAVLEAGVYPDYLVDKDRYLAHHYTNAFADLGGQSVELARYEGLRWGPTFGGDYLLDDPGDWELADTGPRVYGWSVLAPLLRFGDFHEQFLTPVATAIIQFDQQRNGDWRVDGEEPVSFDTFDDNPTSAMDAVLQALARNPAATEAVFEATGDQRVQALLSDG
jgi:hypothetical protein